MYVKSTRPRAKREVQKERSAQRDDRALRSAKRDDQIARPRRAKRHMRMCPRSGQIFLIASVGHGYKIKIEREARVLR